MVFIKLDFGDVSKFLDVTSQLNCDFDLSQRGACVDGKSLIGVLALDLSQPIKVRVISDSDVIKEKFLNMLKLQGIFYEVKESI